MSRRFLRRIAPCTPPSSSDTLVSVMVFHFLVRGRVQGVGFRWFVHREASELELKGWVRNTEDGDVEVVVAGDLEGLTELRTSLQRGPRGSRVDEVIQHTLADTEGEGLSAFKIEGAW
jgi:acylphosphatase